MKLRPNVKKPPIHMSPIGPFIVGVAFVILAIVAAILGDPGYTVSWAIVGAVWIFNGWMRYSRLKRIAKTKGYLL